MKGIQSNGFLPIIAQAIAEMEELHGEFTSMDEINLAELGRRTGISRAKLMSYFPPRHSAGAAMNSTFLSPASSLRITLAWSAADCRWSLEKCGMMACSTFTKAILF